MLVNILGSVCCLFLIVFAVSSRADDTDSIMSVHVLFRHGDRNPVFNMSELDPNNNSTIFGVYAGQLTERGQARAFSLGQYLRKTYGNLIGDKYDPTVINVRSTNVDRTLMSAESVLAAMFPREVTTNELPPFEPIPIHTEPVESDYLSVSCDGLIDINMNSTELRKEVPGILNKYEDSMNKMGSCIGVNITAENVMKNILFAYDTVEMEETNNYTVLPCYSDFFPEPVTSIFGYINGIQFNSTEHRKLIGGMFLNDVLIGLMHNSSDTRRFFAYAAHDLTILGVLTTMGAFNNIPVPLSAALILELHNLTKGKYIKVMYRNATTGPASDSPLILSPFNCGTECPLENFTENARPYFPTEGYIESCEKLYQSSVATTLKIGNPAIILIVVLISLNALLFHA